MHFCCECLFRNLPQHGFSKFQHGLPSMLFLFLHQASDFGCPDQGYWPVLFTWANFLVNSLPDPGKQLCTDDFEVSDRFGCQVKGISLWKRCFWEDDNKHYLRAWSCMGWCGSWMKNDDFFLDSFCVLVTASVCRGRIHTMWTWHLACTHFEASVCDNKAEYIKSMWFLAFRGPEPFAAEMSHKTRKTEKIQEEFILTPFERNLLLWCDSKYIQCSVVNRLNILQSPTNSYITMNGKGFSRIWFRSFQQLMFPWDLTWKGSQRHHRSRSLCWVAPTGWSGHAGRKVPDLGTGLGGEMGQDGQDWPLGRRHGHITVTPLRKKIW